MMVNDTIVNAKNFSDRLCNEVILWSNDFARDLGVSYGELWAGITIFVAFTNSNPYHRKWNKCDSKLFNQDKL